MSSRLPPTPAENRSPKGAGEGDHADQDRGTVQAATDNPDKLGHQGNSKVNTTHQGYQQDR